MHVHTTVTKVVVIILRFRAPLPAGSFISVTSSIPGGPGIHSEHARERRSCGIDGYTKDANALVLWYP
jgi:hypothetical protein